MSTTNELHGAIELDPAMNRKLEGLYREMKLKDPEPITYEAKRMTEDHIKVVQDGKKPDIYDGKYSHAWLDMRAEDREEKKKRHAVFDHRCLHIPQCMNAALE